MTHTIEKTLIVAATPIKIWDYLTKADRLAIWFHKPTGDLAQGAAFTMPGEDGAPLVWGHVHIAKPPHTLAYSFSARPMGDLVTEVEWTLTAVEAGTRIHLIHKGFPEGSAPFALLTAFDTGWDKHLAGLRENIPQ